MASKFFNKPQLGQAQLSNAQQSNLPTNDIQSEMKAQQAARGIDALAGAVNTLVGNASHAYVENINAKHRLESSQKRPLFLKHIEENIMKTENFDSLSDEALDAKYKEFSNSFNELHKDKPYASQLRQDMSRMGEAVLTNMMQKRDAMHTKIVTDAISQDSYNSFREYDEGMLDDAQLQGRLAELMYNGTEGLQVPSSEAALGADEGLRNKYRGVTKRQALDTIIKSATSVAATPNNSRLVDMLDSESFREEMSVKPTDQDYNKMIKVLYNKGAKADKVNYENGLDGLKESLYTKTNQGFNVDIDKELELHRATGALLTAQDEHKLRKAFKIENSVNTNSMDYREGLLNGKDLSAGLSRKDKEAVYERSFTDILDLNEEGISIENVSSSLSTREGQVGFSDYLRSGGKLPDKFVQMFDVPAGSSAEKWSRASAALVTMQAAATGSGQSIEEIIGVKAVTKIRGMSKIYNDPDMEDSVKQNAIDALQTQSTSFNSKGYLKGTQEAPIDNEWLSDVSKDAPWTTDDYVSDQQNSAEIAGNYHAYRMAGNSDGDAKELALDLFNKSNRSMEMSNGGEIVVPVKHKHINNVSIDEFSKSVDANGNPRFPSIQEQRDDLEVSTGQGWISEWRARTNISFQKSYNYGKTGNYDMLYNGKLVDQGSFSYTELEEFISKSPSRLREKMLGGKHRSIAEVEEDALKGRRKNIKKRGSIDTRVQSLFDLKI